MLKIFVCNLWVIKFLKHKHKNVKLKHRLVQLEKILDNKNI